MSTAIISTGGALPEKTVTNNDLSALVDTNDQWITERTGIRTRQISTGQSATSLAQQAAMQAIERSGLKPEDIDLVIFSTITPDSLVPSAACRLRNALGIGHAVAFDINAACTGFIYALAIADSMMKNSSMKNALVVGCELLSRITEWTDRSTCVLFGDGAGAAVLQSRPDAKGILDAFLDGENDANGSLTCDINYDATPFCSEKLNHDKIEMNGQAVFRYAVGAMNKSILAVLEKAGKTPADIDWIVPHQANLRIIDSAVKKLKIPREKFFTNLDHCGNTSSASIPMALNALMETGKVKKGDLIVLTGFGGGFTSGAILFEAEC